MIPGGPVAEGAAGQPGQIPKLEEGTAEYVIQQVAIKLAAGEQDGLEGFISEKVKGRLGKFRDGEADQTDVAEAKQELAGVQFINMRDTSGGKTVTLRNGAGQVVTFTAKREEGGYKVSGFKVETPRGRR